MRRGIRRAAVWVGSAVVVAAVALSGLIIWPTPLFAFAIGAERIVVASDRPIPVTAGERLIHDCTALLERSPLKVENHQYHLYVANDDWRHFLYFLPVTRAGGLTYFFGFGGNAFLSGADFTAGRLVKWGYVAAPPRTLAYFCAHELTHIVTGEYLGLLAYLRQPQWVHEGFPDYVAIENRESFAQLRDALGNRPVDVRMMQAYGAYPRDRLLVTFFLEKKGWSVDALLRTRLSYDDAMAIMHAEDR